MKKILSLFLAVLLMVSFGAKASAEEVDEFELHYVINNNETVVVDNNTVDWTADWIRPYEIYLNVGDTLTLQSYNKDNKVGYGLSVKDLYDHYNNYNGNKAFDILEFDEDAGYCKVKAKDVGVLNTIFFADSTHNQKYNVEISVLGEPSLTYGVNGEPFDLTGDTVVHVKVGDALYVAKEYSPYVELPEILKEGMTAFKGGHGTQGGNASIGCEIVGEGTIESEFNGYKFVVTTDPNYKLEEPTPKPTPTEEAKGSVVVNVDALNVRDNAGLNGKVLEVAKKGATYSYYEVKEADGYKWYRIGENKWVADNGNYLTVDGKTNAQPTTTQPVKEVPVVKTALKDNMLFNVMMLVSAGYIFYKGKKED